MKTFGVSIKEDDESKEAWYTAINTLSKGDGLLWVDIQRNGQIFNVLMAEKDAKSLDKVLTQKTALLIIDVQNDYCEGGSLEINDASSIVPKINYIRELHMIDYVVRIRDWHP